MLNQRGFTLFELLVVIVIIGIILSFATLAVNVNTPAQVLQRDLQRLQALMQLAQEEAILQSKTYGLSISTTGYRFYQLEESTWLPLERDAVLRSRQWTAPVEVDLQIEGLSVLIDERAEKPQIFWFSDGETVPFVLRLDSNLAEDVTLYLQTNELGELVLEE